MRLIRKLVYGCHLQLRARLVRSSFSSLRDQNLCIIRAKGSGFHETGSTPVLGAETVRS